MKKRLGVGIKKDMWNVGPPNCPHGYAFNGKTRCWKLVDGKGHTFVEAKDICNNEHTNSGYPRLAKGSAKVFQFNEEEDFVMLKHGLVQNKEGYYEKNIYISYNMTYQSSNKETPRIIY